MKVDDSGMPEEAYWNSLFDIEGIVDWLAIPKTSTIVEIGCGYGTFTVPIAKTLAGELYAFDIESSMIKITRENVRKSGLSNVTVSLRDVLEQGTGIEPNSTDMVLFFNILHFNERKILLAEAARILKNRGIAAIIHWRKDIPTPRGPAINVRPDKEQILNASEELNLNFCGNSRILEPYHWGIQLVKKEVAI
jgi:ubiquinone/menaquinone biosynthesis C-methylase UbiE